MITSVWIFFVFQPGYFVMHASSHEAECYESFPGFSALVCINPVAHSPQSPPSTPQPDPCLWNRERNASVIELLSFIFLPFARFSLIECVLSIRVGCAGGRGWVRGRRREGWGGGFDGRVLRHKSLWWKGSFTLLLFPSFLFSAVWGISSNGLE